MDQQETLKSKELRENSNTDLGWIYLESWALEQEDELPGIPAAAALHVALQDFNHFTGNVENVRDYGDNHLWLVLQAAVAVRLANYGADLLVHTQQVGHFFGSQHLAEEV